MGPLRRSLLPGLSLSLLMGLALAWPGLAHHPLHAAHGHEHHEGGATLTPAQLGIGSAEENAAHPHLELTATTPAKCGLYLFFAMSTAADADVYVSAPAVMVGFHPILGQPRSPPFASPPPIRAPPTV
jgi:hypothetical protein